MKIFSRKLVSFSTQSQAAIHQISKNLDCEITDAIRYYEAIVSLLSDKYKHKIPNKIQTLVDTFIEKSPKAGHIPIYRGVSVSDQNFTSLQLTKVYQPHSYSHWSKSREIGISYLDARRPYHRDGVNMLFQCPTANNGVDIGYIARTTPFGIEEEILMPKDVSFKIMSIEESKPDANYSLKISTYCIVKVIEN